MVTIYALVCPLSGNIRWVGKTTESLERRISKHLRHGTARYNAGKQAWLDQLRIAGVKPRGIVLDQVPDDAWISAETWWIELLTAQGVSLLNVRRPC